METTQLIEALASSGNATGAVIIYFLYRILQDMKELRLSVSELEREHASDKATRHYFDKRIAALETKLEKR